MARVLLVEDNEQIWDFLSRRLQKRGHEVFLAHDGEQGVSSAETTMPQVILLDMNLPVMDGWSAAKAIKGNPRTHDIPIIALTAHAMAGAREKALQAGCDDYHAKPVDFLRLLEQIDNAVGNAPTRGAGA